MRTENQQNPSIVYHIQISQVNPSSNKESVIFKCKEISQIDVAKFKSRTSADFTLNLNSPIKITLWSRRDCCLNPFPLKYIDTLVVDGRTGKIQKFVYKTPGIASSPRSKALENIHNEAIDTISGLVTSLSSQPDPSVPGAEPDSGKQTTGPDIVDEMVWYSDSEEGSYS